MAEAENTVKQCDDKLAAARATADRRRLEATGLRATEANERDNLGEGPDDPDAVTRQRDAAADQAKTLRDAAVAAGDTLRAAQTGFDQADTAVTAAVRELRTAETAATEAATEATTALQAHGFATDHEQAAALLPAARQNELKQNIADFDDKLVAATARVESTSAAAEGLAPPDLPAAEQALAAADAALSAAVSKATAAAERVKQIDQLRNAWTKIAKDLADADARYAVTGQLADWSDGKNAKNLRFHRFVLQFLLEEVLEAATHRLLTMSRNRYRLRLRESASRASEGLELDVDDDHTGESRPVATLSGGEGFLASLSLALGLADVVQARSGGVRLDAIFIDEGFGSLDPETLDIAVSALADLTQDPDGNGGSARLVGLISHVGELQRQIPATLEVTAKPEGSRAAFRIG